MASFDHYLHELQSRLIAAATTGASHVTITSTELQSAIAGRSEFMQNCFQAMENELRTGDTILMARDSASGMSVTYLLPRQQA